MKTTMKNDIDCYILKEDEYQNMISEGADRLCGYSCGTAVDIILEYVSRADCSGNQLSRLQRTLNFKYNTL